MWHAFLSTTYVWDFWQEDMGWLMPFHMQLVEKLQYGCMHDAIIDCSATAVHPAHYFLILTAPASPIGLCFCTDSIKAD